MSNVEHPAHYNFGKIEVIDAIEDWGFGEGFNRGNGGRGPEEGAVLHRRGDPKAGGRGR